MHPLDAPGSLWVLSNDGKYLARPQAGETSHKKQASCRRQETGLPFFFPHHKGFRLCGGDQGAFRSPPGPLRGPCLYAWAKPPTRNKLLAEGRKRAYLSFPYRKRFRLCGGDQRAFRSPFGNLRPLAASRNLCKKQLTCRGQENAFLSFPVSQTLSPLRRRPGSFPLAPLSPFRWRKIFLPPHGASAT